VTIEARSYVHASDYERVGQFLVDTYRTEGPHINWLQPRWEYMHHCSGIVNVDLSTIGVWESDGEVVAVVHPEHFMGTAYFEIDPDHGALKKTMLAHAEERISAAKGEGKSLAVYINDRDDGFRAVATEGIREDRQIRTDVALRHSRAFPRDLTAGRIPAQIPGGWQ